MAKEKHSRHVITQNYDITSIKRIVNELGLPEIQKQTLAVDGWTDRTPEGLSKFIMLNIPDWQHLILKKHTEITDPQKKKEPYIVSVKDSCLEISYKDIADCMSVKVERNLTKNGKIPVCIRDFINGR